jgi:hypothetical protein
LGGGEEQGEEKNCKSVIKGEETKDKGNSVKAKGGKKA